MKSSLLLPTSWRLQFSFSRLFFPQSYVVSTWHANIFGHSKLVHNTISRYTCIQEQCVIIVLYNKKLPVQST